MMPIGYYLRNVVTWLGIQLAYAAFIICSSIGCMLLHMSQKIERKHREDR